MDTTPNLTIKATMHGPEQVPSMEDFQTTLELVHYNLQSGNLNNVGTMFARLGLHIRSLTSRVAELEAGYVRPHFSPN